MDACGAVPIFDGEQAKQYAREIAFPRKVGTEGERRAAETIIRRLKELGYHVRQEEFFVRVPAWVWMKGFLILSLCLLVLTQWTFDRSPVISLLCTGVLIVWILSWEKLWLRLGRWAISEGPGKRTRSRNIFAEVPAHEDGQLLYLVAHYDSKSQSLNLYIRAIFFLLGNLGLVFLVGWIWVDELMGWETGGALSLPAWVQIIFVAVCLFHLVYLLGPMGNDSDGAVDNASGVGVLLEVARLLRLNPLPGVRPVFLFTGAEEWGLLGALMAARKHGPHMLRSKAFVINVDSVGRGRVLRACSMGKEGKHWLGEIIGMSRAKGLEVRRLPFLRGIMMDHLAFGPVIPAVSLTSIYGEGWHIHTSRNTLALVQAEGLKAMGSLVLAILDFFGSRRIREDAHPAGRPG
jgi:hypothetical protein